MNKKRTPKRQGNAKWRSANSTLNYSLRTQQSVKQWTQKDWNKAAILGIAVVLFNFAFRETQTRVILASAGAFWILFCLFRVIRLLTAVTLGVFLSVFAFLGATKVISSPELDTFSIICFFILFTCGLYCTVSFSKKLFLSYLKDIYDKIVQLKETDESESDTVPDVDELSLLHPTAAKDSYVPALERAQKPGISSVEATIKGSYTYDDELFPAAVDIVLETGQASTSMLQRQLKLGYSRAFRLLNKMEQMGYVGPFQGSVPRRVFITPQQWAQMSNRFYYSPPKFNDSNVNTEQAVRDEENWRREKLGLSPVEYELQKVDAMEGHAFEEWCANLLKRNGFSSVNVTPGSGDQGVDITAEKDGLKYAIQCKRYSSDLGNTPVQEVVAGKAFYRCHVGAVMTNRYFTSGAKELAKANGILLWDRNVISGMLKTENSSLSVEKQDG